MQRTTPRTASRAPRFTTGVALLSFALAAACSAPGEDIQAPPVDATSAVATADYALVSSYTGKYIDIYGSAKANGSAAGQWTYTGMDNQIWTIKDAGNGGYTFVAKHSGKCLDLLGYNAADGAPVGQWDCNGQANQTWKLVGSGSTYQIVNAWNGKCLDVLDWSTANGAPIGVWACKGAQNQSYALKPTGAAGGTGAGGTTGSTTPPPSGGTTGGAGTTTGGGGTTSPTATKRAQILSYLSSISGNKTLVGIENKNAGTPSSDTNTITGITGKGSSFWGGDFGFGSGAVDNRTKMITEAKAQFAKGALVGLMYHACSPTRDEYCTWDDIGAANHAQLSDAQFGELLTPGTTLYKSWISRLDKLAVFFQDLKNAGVVVAFRPFHEMNQCVFWWSCHKGANGSAKLFQLTHDYLANTKGLDNIIWVWNVQDFTSLNTDVDAYNPGASYFDIAALDVYNTGYTSNNYNAMLKVSAGKPIAIAECQFMPTASLLASQPKWIYAMLWPDFIDANRGSLPPLYGAGNVVTLDEMPGWK